MSWKDAYIAKHGKEAYEKHKEQTRQSTKKWRESNTEKAREYALQWREEHKDKVSVHNKKYRENHPEKMKEISQDQCRKGGKRYEKALKDSQTGIPGGKTLIRSAHRRQYNPYKKIIAPDSQIHHNWIPGTAEYTGLALVEADAHMHGFIKVIEILEGGITLFTEKEIREQKI